jgi:hypothetical protein
MNDYQKAVRASNAFALKEQGFISEEQRKTIVEAIRDGSIATPKQYELAVKTAMVATEQYYIEWRASAVKAASDAAEKAANTFPKNTIITGE